jgi:secondary thiamine-phosphate synthase enzyme
MRQAATILRIETRGRGFYDITARVVGFAQREPMRVGLLTVFCRHTSASLLIQENADPTVLKDFERFFAQIAPEGPGLYAHEDEGADDMPAHLRAALTQTQLSIPLIDGVLALGVWQGIYLIEHRRRPHVREAALHLLGE